MEPTEQDYGLDNLDNWNNWVEKANAEAEANPEVFTDDFGDIATLEQEQRIEPTLEIPDTNNRMFYTEELEQELKKNLKSPEELSREAEYDSKEQDDNFVTARQVWEDTYNMRRRREAYKHSFIKGEIDSLPWETPAQADNYNSNTEGYQQNAEQSESTLFNKLSKK